ncbi:hypothetical protein E2562_008265 [Oryza meyeriana var. granulata]|uniref:Uncharacterized protein n=1 Tax=Oryza meyeriana var. granulata TaxID=110450 RepID=A0A6G1DG56_9ORYZ|nr:hypothetical protein E2562_008265 [Oryza meyeriana var. granulata]
MQFVTRCSKPYAKPVEKSNPQDKATFKPKQVQAMEATTVIPSLQASGATARNHDQKGAIDADLLKSLKNGKKMAANIATVQGYMAAHHIARNNRHVNISLKEKVTIDSYTPQDPPCQLAKDPKSEDNSEKGEAQFSD